MIGASIICSIVTMIYNLIISGYSKIAVPVLLLMLVVRIISAIIFCVILTPMLADALAKAGILKGYAVSGDVEEDLDE